MREGHEEGRAQASSSASSEDGGQPEGVEVLATLSALGVSDELRSRVQEAIQQLEEQLTSSSINLKDPTTRAATHPAGTKQAAKAPADAKPGGSSSIPKVQTVEAKLQMSRSIMRKLHHKNVALEKELQVGLRFTCHTLMLSCRSMCLFLPAPCAFLITIDALSLTLSFESVCVPVAPAAVQSQCQPHYLLPVNHRAYRSS